MKKQNSTLHSLVLRVMQGFLLNGPWHVLPMNFDLDPAIKPSKVTAHVG